jgi:hypothetical protein
VCVTVVGVGGVLSDVLEVLVEVRLQGSGTGEETSHQLEQMPSQHATLSAGRHDNQSATNNIDLPQNSVF